MLIDAGFYGRFLSPLTFYLFLKKKIDNVFSNKKARLGKLSHIAIGAKGYFSFNQ
jgi:hypothetical protein